MRSCCLRAPAWALALLLAWPGRLPAQSDTAFFDDTVLHEIRLSLNPADWAKLKGNVFDNTYYPANLTWREQQVEDVGIRFHGRTSRNPNKPNLRVDFNRFEEKQTFLGLKSVVLRANTQDPTMLRERLAMLFFRRMGLYASREASTRLFVNGGYAGLYTIVESVDKKFLERNLGEDDGYLYKFEKELIDGPYYFGYGGDTLPKFFKPETHELNNDAGPLVALIKAINTSSDADFIRSVSVYLDLRHFLTYLAVEQFLLENDGFLGDGGMNNFYIYRLEKKNLHILIPWDKSNVVSAGPDFTYWRGVVDLPESQQNILMRRCLTFPELRAIFLEALAECSRIAGGSDGLLAQELERQYQQTRSAALEDTHKPYTSSEFEVDVAKLRDFFRRRDGFVFSQAAKDLAPLAQHPYSVADRTALSIRTTGTGATARSGYVTIAADGAARPAGVAVLGFRQDGVLVSEAGVSASGLVSTARIYAEAGGGVRTGLAIVNPNESAATVTFYFTDRDGKDSEQGTTTIPARSQVAEFLDQSRFKGSAFFSGSFTFSSSVPVSALALRGLTNERSDFLVTTLPVAQPGAASAQTVLIPDFADGGGWTTQILLVNPTDSAISGGLDFVGQNGEAASVTIDGATATTFTFSIPPRSARRLQTSGASSSTRSGSVRVTPDGGSVAPAAQSIVAFRSGGITVAEAGIPAVAAGAAFRSYAEFFRDGARTGVAVANPSSSPATVTLELYYPTGVSAGVTGRLTVPAGGQVAQFLDQIAGFESMPVPFEGVLRLSTTSASGISAAALRLRFNERADLLLTTVPMIREGAVQSSGDQFFPHMTDSGGYTTQFILFNGAAGATASGMLRFVAQTGLALPLLLW